MFNIQKVPDSLLLLFDLCPIRSQKLLFAHLFTEAIMKAWIRHNTILWTCFLLIDILYGYTMYHTTNIFFCTMCILAVIVAANYSDSQKVAPCVAVWP
uniref:Uncharacterized protein n=1 Tax=Rhipicephalus zambeziensis TaxID=60191 RepID=A0A224YAX2_9ACAR